MPNIEDLNTSFDESITFSPIASSSQQCFASVQQVDNGRVNCLLQTAQNMNETLPGYHLSSVSSFGLWSSYMTCAGNENEQEITLTQLHSIGSNQYLWNLQQWKDACEEYHKTVEGINIREIKRQMKNSQGNVFPLLIALIIREDNTKDTLALQSTITITLRDPSGEIKAMIFKDLWDCNQHIQPNSVLVLRNFRVLPITRVTTKYYLMLNQWNVKTVFSTGNDNSAKKVLLLCKDDIEKYQQSLEIRANCKQITINNVNLGQTLKPHTTLSTITNKLKRLENNIIKATNCHEKREVTFSNQTTLIMPDLDLDLDVESDVDLNYAPCKKSKPDVAIAHDQQQAQEDRVQLNVGVEQVKNIVIPKKALKYVKRNNMNPVSNAVLSTVTNNLDLGVTQKPPETMVVERHSQILFTTQNADDSRILEKVFDGMDLSCLLDDF